MAVINAINNACGVRVYDLPAKPEKVKAILDAQKNGQKVKLNKMFRNIPGANPFVSQWYMREIFDPNHL